MRNRLSTMEKTICERDVLIFINAAPLGILKRLKDELDRRVEKLEEDDHKRGVMRAFMFNGAPPPSKPEPTINLNSNNSDEGEDDGATSVESEAANSIRDRLMQMTKNISMDNTDKLREQLKAGSSSNEDIRDLPAEFVYIESDTYGDGLVAPKNADLVEFIKNKHEECQRNGWYFPYGFGKEKNLLKIKKFKRNEKGMLCRASLNFSKWSQNGRTGFSCYANTRN